jgi:hypothetical protein
MIIKSILLLGILAMSACSVVKPYEKEYLLNPLMDDASVAKLQGNYVTKTRPNERLAAAGGSSGSTSCPTCGGK